MVQFPREISLHDAFFNVWAPIVLEDGVVLGHQVMFLSGRHEVDPSGVQRDASSGGPIHVHRGAWIGSRATILGGVTIGEGAVIGAGSVVTRSVPAHEFWAGNPARYIRPAHT
jgi:maltose O-acetyltransferase